MNYPFLTLAAVTVFFIACKEKKPEPQPDTTVTATADTVKAATPFFPVFDYLRGEIDYVDSLPVGIMKYRTKGSKTDSGYIKLKEFHKLASEFLPAEMMDPVFSKEFKETSFFDRSNNNSTFLYNTENDSIPVKRIDVITAKGDIYDEVKSVYIEKSYQAGDTSVVIKLIWKPKRNFQIIKRIFTKSEEPINELIKVVWDNRE